MTLSKEELLTVSTVLTSGAYRLLDNNPGDPLFQEQAQSLLLLANRFTAEIYEQEAEDYILWDLIQQQQQ